MPENRFDIEDDRVHNRRIRRMPHTPNTPELPNTHAEEHEQGDAAAVVAAIQDGISTEGHPVPVRLIVDHLAQLAVGIYPATCKVCSAPMELHAQFAPTHQASADVTMPEILVAHLASEHGMTDLPDINPDEDGLIIDRLYDVHEAKHAAFIKGAPYGIPKEKGGDSKKNDAKMEDCVKKVMAKGHSKESAIKICKKSLGFTKHESIQKNAWADESICSCGHHLADNHDSNGCSIGGCKCQKPRPESLPPS